MIKIVTYNIQFGQGRDGKVDLGRIIDSVKGADLIALQEVDRFGLARAKLIKSERSSTLLKPMTTLMAPELIRPAVKLIMRVDRFADSLAIFCSAGSRLSTAAIICFPRVPALARSASNVLRSSVRSISVTLRFDLLIRI